MEEKDIDFIPVHVGNPVSEEMLRQEGAAVPPQQSNVPQTPQLPPEQPKSDDNLTSCPNLQCSNYGKRVLASTTEYCPECGAMINCESPDNPSVPNLGKKLLDLIFESPSKLDMGEHESPSVWYYGNTGLTLHFDVDTAEIICIANNKYAYCKNWFVNEETHTMVLPEEATTDYTPISYTFIISMIGQIALEQGGLPMLQRLLTLL